MLTSQRSSPECRGTNSNSRTLLAFPQETGTKALFRKVRGREGCTGVDSINSFEGYFHPLCILGGYPRKFRPRAGGVVLFCDGFASEPLAASSSHVPTNTLVPLVVGHLRANLPLPRTYFVLRPLYSIDVSIHNFYIRPPPSGCFPRVR